MANELRAATYMPKAQAIRVAKQQITQQKSPPQGPETEVNAVVPTMGWRKETKARPTPKPRQDQKNAKPKATTDETPSVELRENPHTGPACADSSTAETENATLRSQVLSLQEMVNRLNDTITGLNEEILALRAERKREEVLSSASRGPK